MTQLASFVRVTLLATTAIALASACGGQSFSGNGGDGGDSGSGQGGTTSHAGTTSTAGKGHAGSSVGGTGSGGTGFGGSGVAGGSSGSGGVASEECNAPPDGGNCDAYDPSWYHDPATGICRPFVYGGCGGNKNRYQTLEDCNKACPGGNPNYDACKVASDCMVTGVGCCGVCDSANVTAHDLIAYNKQYDPFLQCAVALTIPPPGSGVSAPIACAPCQQPAPGTGTLMYFVPDCVANQCVVQDLRTSPVTACKTSDECQLRHGTGCCEGCSNADLVSVRNDGSFEKLVCGDAPMSCPACVAPPTDAQPFCGPNGRCEVVLPL